jgi:rod shape determining protein RodA
MARTGRGFLVSPYFRYFDITSVLLIIGLQCLGLVFVFSTTCKMGAPLSVFFKKQLFGVMSGLCLYALFARIDYRTTLRYGYLAFYVLVGLLALTLIKGTIGMGAQRWINMGLFRTQPSELAKILFPAYAIYTLQSAHLSLPLPR